MLLYLLFILFVAISPSHQDDRCSKPYIKAVGARKFQICSADADGQLTTKYGECGLETVFSLEDKMCVPQIKRKGLRDGASAGSATKCYKKGYTCSGCSQLDYCLDRGNGLEVVASKKCKETEFCSAYNNTCTTTVIPQCQDGYAYTCNYMGLFPDPYKCHTYYFCQNAGSEALVMTCPPGHYYHPLYAECIAYQVDHDAPCPPMQQCTADNSMKALAINPNIYYLCIQTGENEFMTRVFRCPRGQIFNGSRCVANSPAPTSGIVTSPLPI